MQSDFEILSTDTKCVEMQSHSFVYSLFTVRNPVFHPQKLNVFINLCWSEIFTQKFRYWHRHFLLMSFRCFSRTNPNSCDVFSAQSSTNYCYYEYIKMCVYSISILYIVYIMYYVLRFLIVEFNRILSEINIWIASQALETLL